MLRQTQKDIFEIVYRRLVLRLVLRLGHNKTIGAIAPRLCQLIWIILHNSVRYEERRPTICEKAKRARTLANDSDTANAWLPSRTCRYSGMRKAFSIL